MQNKIILFVALFLFVSMPAFAKVTWEVISKQTDERGNIEIHTQYKINDVEVVSSYPQENGKYIWVTRYSFLNFYNTDGSFMTDQQIKDRIFKDLDDFASSLIVKEFSPKENLEIISKNLDTLVGSTKDVLSYTIQLKDEKGDIVKTIEVKDDGTKIESSPVVADPKP